MRLDEIDVGADLGNAVFPIVFVLDRNVTVELLLLQLIQAGGEVHHAGAGDHHRRLSVSGLVLEVHADDPAFENAQAFDGLEV